MSVAFWIMRNRYISEAWILQPFSTMVYFKILAGYDVFVATYLFDSDALSLSVTGRSPTGDSPSWIFQHLGTSDIL